MPGSDAIHSYAGVIEGVTTLRIGENVEAKVENMRVIDIIIIIAISYH